MSACMSIDVCCCSPFSQTTFDQDDVFLALVVDVYDGEATAKVSHARQDDHPEKGTIEDGVAFRRLFAPTA